MLTRISRLFALALMVTSIVLAPAANASSAATPSVGYVAGGPDTLDETMYEWLAYQGFLQAANDHGAKTNTYYPVSTDTATYIAKLNECARGGNALCIATGFGMMSAMQAAATANPRTKFAVVDVEYENYPPNLRGIVFREDEAGYLAGYLAGKMTSQNVVGSIGGMAVPPVDRFLNGFRNGAQCADPNVIVLSQYVGDFFDTAAAASIAQSMIQDGTAEVIFAAAGPAGNGALDKAAEWGMWAIGVDTDQYITYFENGARAGADHLLTSAMKRLDNAVYQTVEDTLDGNFTSGSVSLGAAEDGIGLAPFHDADASIPAGVKTELVNIYTGLANGTIHTANSCRIGYVTSETSDPDISKFEYPAYMGFQKAATDHGASANIYHPSTSYDTDAYLASLNQCASDGNAICIGTGFPMIDAMHSAANANPDVLFALVDSEFGDYPSNLRGIVFREDQAGYLAGYLAGKMTASNVVGAVGGIPVPAVMRFLNGYRNGAQCANRNARVLLTYTNSFTDPDLGASIAQDMINNSADVIFGAGGNTGYGAVLKTTSLGVWAVGVDTDQYITLFDNGLVIGADHLLTSAIKRMDKAVEETVDAALSGNFTNGVKIYGATLDGIGLAPFHDASNSIPDVVKTRLENLYINLAEGTVSAAASCRQYAPFIIR